MGKGNFINVEGARVHNLKNIDIQIPRDQLVVITGLSGSGKSSLAFDTIYAEGQRRYMDTFSSYARHFIGTNERPDVDKIDGLSPVIAIEQKTTSKSPRSTVGTITEIYDFMRLLFAKTSDAYSYVTGLKMVKYSTEEISSLILKDYNQKDIIILSPVVKSRKGHYRELFETIIKKGFLKVRIDGEICNLERGMKVNRYQIHDIEIVIDRIKIENTASSKKRLLDSINTALYHGNDTLMVSELDSKSEPRYFSSNLMCSETGMSYPAPESNLFSFNSPKGMCTHCKGLGIENKVDITKIIPNEKKSIANGGLAPLGNSNSNWIRQQLKAISEKFKFKLTDPIKNISKEAKAAILYGAHETFTVKSEVLGLTKSYKINFDGIVNFIHAQYNNNESKTLKKWASEYIYQSECPKCKGARLRKEACYFKINDKSIHDLSTLDINALLKWFLALEDHLTKRQLEIGKDVLKEIISRLEFLTQVGLDYLTLNRESKSLSGGEAQRIRLATQIGSQLIGVLYILDEPSIGLHQRDNDKLIASLKSLRDIGNSIIVVEHDKEMIVSADCVIDIGPGAGKKGGEIIFSGTPKKLTKGNSVTAEYLNHLKAIEIPSKRRKGNGKTLKIKGCSGNNLKSINVAFPLGKMIGITGVSGSGKSTLINETLYPILNKHIYRADKKPKAYKKIEGLEHIDKVIYIDQSPIGRTPRSNPATYCGVFTEIRNLFSKTIESQIRGYNPGRFSFNVKGGRCETCSGGGLKIIEMNFLPDVYVECESCQGKRFNRETLDIRYKGKSISDVLEMIIDEAMDFFSNIPQIYNKIKTLHDVGLGYLSLGQSATTISGGEAQRVKLATELSKKATGNTFFLLDEPTTGLHFEDINDLLKILNMLVDIGNTVLIIEHNLDVIKIADHIIDLGPEGGKNGGQIVAMGTPEEIAKNPRSYTAKYLAKELSN